jgi:DNA-directed RNA polymerase specialized sigma24 family protein
MPMPLSLDARISRLVPEVDPSIQDELQKVLQTLRQAEYPVGVIQMMSRLALRLFRRIYEAAGHPIPSDNLFDVILRAAKGDPKNGVTGYQILPEALDSPLHMLRVFSNKIDHDAERFEMGVEEAELVLNAFLSVLKWFHCKSGLIPKLPSIYAAAPGGKPARKERFQWHVFVSHNRRQKDWVRMAVAQWRQLGLKVFFDEDTIPGGERIVAAIERGIKSSRHVVLVLTPASVAGRWIALETAAMVWSESKAVSRRVFPVMLEKLPEERIRPRIGRWRILDLTDPDLRQEGYHQLLRSLSVKRRWLPAPPPWEQHRPAEETGPDDRPGDVGFTLHIDRDFESFSDDDQNQILSAVKSLLKISRSVTVIRRRLGSVFLTIRLRLEEAKQLLAAIQAGALREHGVLGGEIEELGKPASLAGPPPPAARTEPTALTESVRPPEKKTARVSARSPWEGNGSSVTRLVVSVSAGQEEAMERLWKHVRGDLIRAARARLKGIKQNLADEEDIALSAFRSVCSLVVKKRLHIESRKELWRVLLTATIHKVIDQARREARRIPGGASIDIDDVASSVLSHEPAPDVAASIVEQFDRFMNMLPDETLREIVRHKVAGKTNAEIAEEMGTARRTVERKLEIIRRILSEEIQK